MIELKPDTAATAERAGLALTMLFGDTGDLQPRKRLHIPDQRAVRGSDHHHLIFRIQRGHDILDAWVVPARFGIDRIQQGHAIRRGDFGLCPFDRVEISGGAMMNGNRNRVGSARRIGNVAGRIGR